MFGYKMPNDIEIWRGLECIGRIS